MTLYVQEIDFNLVFPIWRSHLWPDRTDPIRPLSSMLLGGGTDMSIYEKFSPRFLGLFHEDSLVGVLSGHRSSADNYRIRGLYIHEEYRRRGGAQMLFKEFQKIAAEEKGSTIWSYPKLAALPVYKKFGFQPHSSTEHDGKHIYVFYECV